jgi:NAD(P)-dependent dehydrogenase (short-subunit alcohol dehydrogenase family)
MRRILVTGANKGIGFAIATAILDEHDDTFVLLGSRDAARGRAAIEQLAKRRAAWVDRVAPIELDVASDASVTAAARQVGDRYGRAPAPLHAVVNNAGIGLPAGDVGAVLNVNILGVHRVCEAFLPLLDAKAGRIVNISSAAGPNFVNTCSAERRRFFLDDQVEWPALQALIDECIATGSDKAAFAAKGLGSGEPYGLSKACVNSYTMLLAREHPSLRINACTPGFIETDLTRKYAETQGKPPAELGMKPPSAGARAAMFLLFGRPEGNGRYYGSDAVRSPLDRYRAPGDPPFAGD